MLDTNVTEATPDPDTGVNFEQNTTDIRVQVHVRHLRVLDASGSPLNATIFGAFVFSVSDGIDIFIGMRNDRTRKYSSHACTRHISKTKNTVVF